MMKKVGHSDDSDFCHPRFRFRFRFRFWNYGPYSDYPLLEHSRTAPNMSDTVGVTPISASARGPTWAAHQLATEESKMRCLCVVVLLWTAASAPYANVQYLSIACRMFVWIFLLIGVSPRRSWILLVVGLLSPITV